MIRTAYLGLSLLTILVFASPSRAQTQPEADAAYRPIYEVGANPADPKYDGKKAAELSEEYLAKFKEGGPGSAYRPAVFQIMVNGYVASKNLPKLIETADRLAQLMPAADTKLKVNVYTLAMAASSQTNNIAKAMDFGEKILAVDPNNLNALLTLTSAIPANLPADATAKDASLGKALDYATKLAAIQKPQGVTDAQWQETQSLAHSTAGFVHLNRAQYEEAAKEYQQVVTMNPKNDEGQFRLGSAYQGMAVAAQRQVLEAYNNENAAITAKADKAQIDELAAKRTVLQTDYEGKRDKAIDSLAKAVALAGPLAAPARQALEKLYGAKNDGSLEGLDALIAQKKTEFGNN